EIALSKLVVIPETKSGQPGRFYLQHGEIDVVIRTDNTCIDNARATDSWFVSRLIFRDDWHADTHVLRAAHHMRVRDDVTIGIDDYSRSDLLLHADQRTAVSAARIDWSISGCDYLDHARRHLANEFPD